ncbi:MAG: ComEC/Rec2 family competence protein [Pyrinomonadaceae bacterium]
MHAVPHQQSFCANPLTYLAAAFGTGILGSHVLNPSLIPLLALAAVASLFAVVAVLKQRTRVAAAILNVTFLLAGACLASVEKQSVRPDSLKALLDGGAIASGQPVELTGVLERQPELAPSSLYLTLRSERLASKRSEQNVAGVVLLLAPIDQKTRAEEYERLELRYGARVRVMTALNRADNFRNPGVSSLTEYLELKGYDATGVVKSPLLIERLDDERVFLPLAWLYDWRQRLQNQITARFPPQTSSVLLASLLGNRYFLSQTTAERFREGGTFHVLVISGTHISFLGGLVFVAARRITRKRGWHFLLSFVVLWGYALAVGAEASVVRAALMFTIVAFAPVVARHASALNALGAAALVLLVWRPGNLLDPAFQLTFLSVLAIVVLAWPLLQRISNIGSWRPTRDTPHPPACAAWLRSASEVLFWSERNWQREMARLNYSYGLFKAPLAAKLERYHLQRFFRYAFEAFVVSASVQLTLLPLLILYFHRVSLSSLFLNIGVSVLMAMLSITALSGLLIAQVSSALAWPLFSLANAFNWLMVHSVDPFARLGIASLRLPEYSGWSASIYALYYLPAVILAASLSNWNPLGQTLAWRRHALGAAHAAALAQVVALALIITHPRSSDMADGRLHVNFLDVGQGDSAFIRLPDGTTLLVDGGGRPKFQARGRRADGDPDEAFERDTRSIGEAVISEYLWGQGVDRLDYVIATHADADHIDGLSAVVRNFAVRSALVARTPRDDVEFAAFYDSAQAEGVPVSVIGAGDLLRFGSTAATILWPPPTADPRARSGNNQSIVLRLLFGQRSILLTGDIEKRAEAAMLERPEVRQQLRADVVKVAHHGSKSSSTQGFIDAASPRFAIISVGQTSIFGHPHKEVSERWRSTGAEVLTTGRCGMITVTTDGQNLEMITFVRK